MKKYLSALSLLTFCAPVPGLAQSIPVDFATGQAARVFIGQTQAAKGDPGASDTLLGGMSGVAYANNMLFVADSNRVGSGPDNNRVLIYRDVAGMIPKPTALLFYTQRCPICVGRADIVLGQPDFTSVNPNQSDVLGTPPSAATLRRPLGVASDGTVLAVADTDNNRVLIWNHIPTANDGPADVVVGQPDFTHGVVTSAVPSAASMRGPQGVWIQDGMLLVADTGNNRILIYKGIPTANGAAADVVLGVPDFATAPPLTEDTVPAAAANNLLNPVAVTSDGVRLYVSDLGYNRVLIWNSIPTANQAPADLVVGQPDMISAVSNNSYSTDSAGNATKVLCDSNGTDTNGKPTFPPTCLATLSMPRFALSDGQRLFIADGGNDRVLVFSQTPQNQNGPAADYVLGQVGGGINQASDAADSMRTPLALAWDGLNLYVSDTFNRRINVYSPAENNVPYAGVRNAASFEIFAVGRVTISGTLEEKDVFTVHIGTVTDTTGKDYAYTVLKTDTFGVVITSMVGLINAGTGDPYVYASPDPTTGDIILTARAAGADGNNVRYTATVTPSTSTMLVSAGSGLLSGGQDAAQIGPGSLVSVVGDNLSDGIAVAPDGATTLPTTLAGTQVYFDGVRAPLLYVSPTQINAQVPFEFYDTTSINAYVRTERTSGLISVTTPVAVTIVPQNPGLFAYFGGKDPRPAVATHYSSSATGTVLLDGSVTVGDVLTVTIENRPYTYTMVTGDTLEIARDALVALINHDPKVVAYAAGGNFARIRLKSRLLGPLGNGIPYSAGATLTGSEILTATNTVLCCANVAGSLVTPDNPALDGETIVFYATGLGLPVPVEAANTGQAFPVGGPPHHPTEFISTLIGGYTANVLYAAQWPGVVGVWEVHLELSTSVLTDPFSPLSIAQSTWVSNIVTIPVYNTNPEAPTGPGP